MRQKVHEIPGRLTVEWDDQVKAMIDTWTNYTVTLDQFKEAVMKKGIGHATGKGVKAWIVDSSAATGAFAQDIQAFIGSDCFPAFAKIGVKYFITINSTKSAVTKMTVKAYSAKTGPNGLKLVEVDSVADAIDWVKKN
jgi:hypothetical protein